MSLFFGFIFLCGFGFIFLILFLIGLIGSKENLRNIAGMLLIGCILGGIWTGIELTRKAVDFAEEVADNTIGWIETEIDAREVRNHIQASIDLADSLINLETLEVRGAKAFTKILEGRSVVYAKIESSKEVIDELQADMEAVEWEEIKDQLTPNAEIMPNVEYWKQEAVENLEYYRAKASELDPGMELVVAVNRDSNLVYISLDVNLKELEAE